MASHLVGQRPVSTFVTPVAGTSPIDANVVRSQDNTNGSTYTGHDADATIHVQDSILGSRSAAATAGRKWLTTDAGAFYLFYDDGAAWNEISYLRSSGGALSGALAITSASANALAVGLNGATNPAFNVDSSTALQVAGLNVIGAVTGGTVAVAVTDSGLNASLTINAKGTGTIGIGSVSTGRVTITPVTTITGALTLSAALTYGGVTLSNAVTGTGNMVLSAGPTFTGTITAAAATFTTIGTSGAITAGTKFISNNNAASHVEMQADGIYATASDLFLLSSAGKSTFVYSNNALNVTFGSATAVFNSTALSGITTLSGSGAVSGFTTLALTGPITVDATSSNAGVVLGNSSNAPSATLKMLVGSTHTAWLIAAQNNVNGGLEITPSTAVGGTTFSTPLVTLTTSTLTVSAATTAVQALTATTAMLSSAAPTVAAAQVGYGSTTQTTIGANGAASALTANPVGYLIINVAGNNRIVPYYNP